MKYGDATAGGIMRDAARQDLPCVVEGCNAHRFARQMCTLHYGRWRKYGDPQREPAPREQAVCTIDGCEREAVSRKMCSSHYAKWRKHGDPNFQSTPQTRRKDGRKRDPQGYVRLYMPEHPNARKGGHIAEHTVVMAEFLGRPLLPTENVHHRNGVRDDNRIENLELWSKCQPSGKRVSDLVAFAKQIIERYGEDPTAYP